MDWNFIVFEGENIKFCTLCKERKQALTSFGVNVLQYVRSKFIQMSIQIIVGYFSKF